MKTAEEQLCDILDQTISALDSCKETLKFLMSESEIHQEQIKNLTKAVAEYRKVAIAHSVRIQALEKLTCIDEGMRKSS